MCVLSPALIYIACCIESGKPDCSLICEFPRNEFHHQLGNALDFASAGCTLWPGWVFRLDDGKWVREYKMICDTYGEHCDLRKPARVRNVFLWFCLRLKKMFKCAERSNFAGQRKFGGRWCAGSVRRVTPAARCGHFLLGVADTPGVKSASFKCHRSDTCREQDRSRRSRTNSPALDAHISFFLVEQTASRNISSIFLRAYFPPPSVQNVFRSRVLQRGGAMHNHLSRFSCHRPLQLSAHNKDTHPGGRKRTRQVRKLPKLRASNGLLLLRQLVFCAERKTRKLLSVSTITLPATVTTRASSVFIETLQVLSSQSKKPNAACKCFGMLGCRK